VLADDLVRGILLEPGCTGVPAHDSTVHVEHKDGIVDDRV
jgi:hypothetical protein